jgi:hypothetical protein
MARVYLFFSRRGAECAEENNKKLSLRSLRLGEKNKYYSFMMNLDFAALHPGCFTIRKI